MTSYTIPAFNVSDNYHYLIVRNNALQWQSFWDKDLSSAQGYVVWKNNEYTAQDCERTLPSGQGFLKVNNGSYVLEDNIHSGLGSANLRNDKKYILTKDDKGTLTYTENKPLLSNTTHVGEVLESAGKSVADLRLQISQAYEATVTNPDATLAKYPYCSYTDTSLSTHVANKIRFKINCNALPYFTTSDEGNYLGVKKDATATQWKGTNISSLPSPQNHQQRTLIADGSLSKLTLNYSDLSLFDRNRILIEQNEGKYQYNCFLETNLNNNWNYFENYTQHTAKLKCYDDIFIIYMGNYFDVTSNLIYKTNTP